MQERQTQKSSANIANLVRSKWCITLLDIVASPVVALCALFLKVVRRIGFKRMPLSGKILLNCGLLPVRNHYYEPFYDPRLLMRSLREDRALAGINFCESDQLALLRRSRYGRELLEMSLDCLGLEFGIDSRNTTFGPGDAEFLYSIIRLFKPKRIIEVGSGFSTLMALRAIADNESEEAGRSCELTCIEPYQAPWLERTSAIVVRRRVEEIRLEFFRRLERDDILFIDSSHVVRPQGDVLYEYLEIVPSLQPGVLVHVHDIFTPKDYPDSWVREELRLWNEQYLLEALLTCNERLKILAALNYLKHHHFEALAAACPHLAGNPAAEPGSLWLQRTDLV